MKFVFSLLVMLSSLELSSTQENEAPVYADLVFLVDSSNNMGEKLFNQVKSFISRTISQLPIGVDNYRIGLAHYNDDLKVDFLLSTFKARNPIMNFIKNKFTFQGGPLMTGNALAKVQENFFNENGRDKSMYPPVLVVITSGPSLDDAHSSAAGLKQDNVRIITMGLKDASIDYLEAIATSPSFAFNIENVRDLTSFPKELISAVQNVVQNNYYVPTTQETSTLINTVPVPTTNDVFNVTNNRTAVCDQGLATDVVLMVDTSQHTISESKDLNNFLMNVVSGLKISDYCVHVGLVTYNNKASLIASVDTGVSKSIVEKFVEDIKASKEKISNIGGAINFTHSELFETLANRKSQGIQQIAILITHRSSSDSVSEAAHLLRQENVRVFTVGIAQANETQMAQIASYPTNHYHVEVKTFSDLSTQAEILLKKIMNAVDQDSFVSPEQTDLIRKGCLNTELADIHFLIHGSGSIDPNDFTQLKTFLMELVEMFDIGPRKVRVGAVQYSNEIQQEFGIGTEYSKTNLKLALQNIRQLGGGTNTGAAINFTRKFIIDPRNVRAESVPVYLIVLTDGESQDSVKEAAEILRGDNVNVYAIGVKKANRTQLLEITGDHKRVHFVYDFDALKDIKNVIAQQICSPKACQQVEADVMFLVDSSGSIGKDNFNKMKTFMKNLINKTVVAEDKVQFGIVQFSDTSMEVLQLNKKGTKAIIWDAIDKMNYMEQTTYTGKALEFVSEYFTEKKGARPKVKKFLILITDGEAHDEVKRAAQSLRNSGVIIISVGVFNANKNQLVEISGKKELVHYMETFDTLKTIEDELIFGICSPQEECSRIQLADIVFVIDSSGSISAEQYNIMKDFIISMVNKSDVGPNNVQFGALKYSDHPTRLFYLNKHSTKLEIIKAIENDIAKGGDTYTAKALDFSKSFFTEKHGSRHRSGVPQILIIITDGDSHDRERLNETSRSLQEAGITLYAIGVAKALTEELKTMAGSKGKWFFVENFYGLNDIFMNVSQDVCNRTECKEDETDIIFLVDGSTSILTTDFEVMKNFMVSVVDDFDIGPNKVHVGIAQYSDAYQPEFKLKTYMDKETLKDNIGNITQIFGNTLIGKALTQTNSDLFIPSNNSRINEGVNQILLVITDGNSQDEVAKPAEALRKRGINIYAVGVGQVSETQLIQIAGSPEKKMSVNNFNELKTIKQRIVRAVCTTPTANNCTVDVIVGFDISTYQNSAKLFHGQNQLKAQIANILNSMMNVKSASCSHGVKPQISVAFYMPNAETHIKTSGFNIYSPDIVRNLETSDVNSPSYLTSHDLQSMWETLRKNNTGKAKMLLVFTDGLDENVEELEKKVEDLQRQGLNALVTVALEGTKDDDIKYIEFGRGFEYNYQLHIGMPDIGDRLAKQMSHVAEKTCCCVFCKCTGESGMPGIYGLHGTKGLPGIKGNQGHSGEEGGEGERGLPGSMGGAGDKGCSGTKGPKGNRGIPGNTNEDGESGLDGIPGELGNSGPTGIKGEMGETGEAGSPGIRGAPGHRGYKGLKGDTGEPGTNSTIPGPKGLRGDPGIEGESGLQGPPGKSGAEGIGKRPGRKAATGPQGIKGVPAEPGFTGDEGLKGPQGDEGIKGIKGEKGRNGLNGLPGSFGVVGSKGNPGNPGAKGKKGELGDPGAKGNPGQEGLRGLVGENGKDDFGAPGKIGIKGQRGFPGDIGVKGEQGDPGITGEHGPKGVPGISISSEKGDIGDPGRPGYRGRRGRKGIKGPATQSPCELIDFIRKTCPCYQGKPACPVYPTELVFSLDMANDVTPAIYTRMTDIVTSILDNINIRENNCPVGARIAVVSYNTYTKYLVRFSDFQSKDKLLKAVKNIPLEKSTRGCDIGSNMRFVARNIFKRSLQGATVRRIAVFFTNGKSDDAVSINTAVMEYNALGIIPAVIAFTPAPAIKKAFSVDDTGRFQLIIIPANVDFKPLIKTLETCTLCYDRCKPDTLCVKSKPLIQKSPIDIGFLLDSSYNVRHSDFEEARSFISTVIDRLDISSTGDRVALVSNTPPGFSPGSDGKPHLEFDLSTYNNQILMKKHLQESTHHLQGPPALGFTLKWTIDNIMSKAPNLRKHKAIIIILSGETSGWDKPTLRDASLKAKCQGYALFVLFIGQTYNNTELLDLASSPIEHHLLQLGRIHKPDFGYALGFIQSFLNSIRLSINKYPPPELKSKCSKLNNTRGKRITSPRDETEGESFHHKKSIWRSGDKSGSSNGMEAPTSLERGPLAIDPVKPYTEQSLSNFSGNREKK